MPYVDSEKLDRYLTATVTIPAEFMERNSDTTGKLIKFDDGASMNMYGVMRSGSEQADALKKLTDVQLAELATHLEKPNPQGGRRNSRRVKKRHASRRAKRRTRRSRS